MSQLKIIKLTNYDGKLVLIGVESIISVEEDIIGRDGRKIICSKIKSRGAMVETHWVEESVEKIWDIINSPQNTTK